MNAYTVKDLSNNDYHSSSAISKSGLDMINKSPLHYWSRYLREDKPSFKQTEAMRFGSLLHNQVLEPDVFDKEFYLEYEPPVGALVDLKDLKAQCKEMGLKTSGTKKDLINLILNNGYDQKLIVDIQKKIYDEENKGKTLIKKEDLDLCKKITSAIFQHRSASRYLATAGQSELSLFWTMNGVECRCRPDFITEDGYIVDLKTTLTASQRGFSRKAVYDYRYHVQAAFYTEGFKACFGKMPKGFVFIACEKTEPFSIGVFSTPPDTFQLGQEAMLKNLATYKFCLENNVWPSYNNDEEMELRL